VSTGVAQEVRTFASVRFRREREQSWLELEALVQQVSADGLRSLAPEEVERFPLLYRSALSSLSVARAIALDRALIEYLDNLTLRAFLAFYSPPLDLAGAARRFLVHGFPSAVRALRAHVLIALLALAIGVVSGFVLVNGNEREWFAALVPSDLAGGRGPASSAADLMANEIAAPVPWPPGRAPPGRRRRPCRSPRSSRRSRPSSGRGPRPGARRSARRR
jgi:hypothetical protein